VIFAVLDLGVGGCRASLKYIQLYSPIAIYIHLYSPKMVASIEKKKICIQTKIYNKQNENRNIEIRNIQKPALC